MGIKREDLWKLRLRDSRSNIATCLEERTYTAPALAELLLENRESWRLPQTLHSDFFIDYLVRTKLLRKAYFSLRNPEKHASYSPEFVVYVKEDVTQIETALAVRRGSRLSHLSAAYVHGLTDIVPRVVYVSKTQPPKYSANQTRILTQNSIDQVFGRPARATGQVYANEDYEVVVLAGQSTEEGETLDFPAPDGRTYPASSLERTLIDCTVRPQYAGGIHEVMSMYTVAKDRLSIRRLRKLLDDLNYLYPYRQAIGFLLDRVAYPQSRIVAFEEPAFEFDFYLDYAMPRRSYSSRWRLYYPEGL